MMDQGMSAQGFKLFVHSLGPILGMTNDDASVYTIIKYAESYLRHRKDFLVTDRPINDAIFKPWVRFLQNNGVKFYFETQIDHFTPNKIVQKDGKSYPVDQIVLALPPTAMSRILQDSMYFYPISTPLQNLFDMSSRAALRGHQTMFSVQVFLDREIKTGPKFCYLADSPWAIIIEPEQEVWKSYGLPTQRLCRQDPRIRTWWNLSLTFWKLPGILFQKPIEQCRPEQVAQDAWAQVLQSETFGREIHRLNGFRLEDVKVINMIPWPTFRWNGKELSTFEPRWANNVGTLPMRPNPGHSFDQVYIAGAWCRNGSDLYSMEAAAETGRKAALGILENLEVSPNFCIYEHRRLIPLVNYVNLKPLRKIIVQLLLQFWKQSRLRFKA
jgi:hypothetical protein